MIKVVLTADERRDYRVVAAEKIRGGEQARKQKDSAAHARILEAALLERNLVLFGFGDHSLGGPAGIRFASACSVSRCVVASCREDGPIDGTDRKARMLEPPAT